MLYNWHASSLAPVLCIILVLPMATVSLLYEFMIQTPKSQVLCHVSPWLMSSKNPVKCTWPAGGIVDNDWFTVIT